MPKVTEKGQVEKLVIPTFPDFRPVEIRDREIVRELLVETPTGTSDFAFTNLFAWQKGFPVEISSLGNHLLLLERPYNGQPQFLPILGPGSIDATAEAIAEFLPRIAHIPEDLIAGYEIFQKKGFKLKKDRDRSDYVYRRESLAELKGDDYQEQREKIRNFSKNAEYQFRPLTPESRSACLALHTEWTTLDSREMDKKLYEYEAGALQTSFDYYAELKLFGGIIEVAGRVEAFAVAEKLDDQMAILLFEKGNPKSHGIFEVLTRECARRVFKDFEYLNFQQDFGNAHLRKMRQAYHPAILIEKYVLERPN